jgi:hypothetical protein
VIAGGELSQSALQSVPQGLSITQRQVPRGALG